MNFSSQSNNNGFTLLEVLIAIAILIGIAFGLSQATTETFKLREQLQREGDFYNGIRLAMNVLERDVEMMYNPLVVAPPKPAPSPIPGTSSFTPPPPPSPQDMAVLNSGDMGQLTQFWEPATDKTGLRSSRFVGTESKMTFISASHVRIYKEAPESELSKITYELKHEAATDETPDGMTLYKTESPNVYQSDDSKDSFANSYPLLYGIRKFKYRYYRKDTDHWESSWDSDKEEFKNIFPDIVEITVDVAGPLRLSFEGKYLFRPEIPLHGLDPSS